MLSRFFPQSGGKTPARRARRPELEVLEDRCVPSVGSPILIAASSKDETAPATASAPNGTSVVVWAREVSAGNRDVFAQLFDANQNKVGDEIPVSTNSDDEYSPDVAMDNHRIVIVFTRALNNDPADTAVRYVLCDSSGGPFAFGPVASHDAPKRDGQV